ncbi:MAG: hypothetical protein OXT49_05515 [Gammaproteobacteria bacterium]|nr:hypothetical protein [Gammaproteobacteria bacterium]
MLRIVITLQLLLSLLASGWVQASAASMSAPIDNSPNPVSIPVQQAAQQDVPPCHQSQKFDSAAEQVQQPAMVSMACCDDGCQCDDFCQSLTFTLPSVQRSWPIVDSNRVLDFAASQWAAVTASSLYRPPIR